eukprot:SAG22_NODE_246_length_13948_cov_12.055744_4_plen_284_part_00
MRGAGGEARRGGTRHDARQAGGGAGARQPAPAAAASSGSQQRQPAAAAAASSGSGSQQRQRRRQQLAWCHFTGCRPAPVLPAQSPAHVTACLQLRNAHFLVLLTGVSLLVVVVMLAALGQSSVKDAQQIAQLGTANAALAGEKARLEGRAQELEAQAVAAAGAATLRCGNTDSCHKHWPFVTNTGRPSLSSLQPVPRASPLPFLSFPCGTRCVVPPTALAHRGPSCPVCRLQAGTRSWRSGWRRRTTRRRRRAGPAGRGSTSSRRSSGPRPPRRRARPACRSR